ncbi:GIY-YIG nuclease family protein [Nocardioides marmoraquaticus]
MSAFVYIVECCDGSFYVGSTRNVERRVWEHNHAPVAAEYTRHRRPVSLRWATECEHIGQAFALEKQIQGWSRAKRLALIEGRFGDLPALSRNRETRQPPTS